MMPALFIRRSPLLLLAAAAVALAVSIVQGGLPPAQAQSATALSALTVQGSTDSCAQTVRLSPDFAAATTSYTATVGYATTHARLTPTVAVSGSTVGVGKSGNLETVDSGSASDPISLDPGDSEINVRVTASDNSTQDYTVTITRRGLTQVSNIGQEAETTTRSTNNAVHAQGFRANHFGDEFTLTSIEAVINASPTQAQRDQIRAELWSGSGGPTQKLHDLTVPDHPITAGRVSFAAPANTRLSAYANYFFVLYTTGTFNLEITSTSSDNEDDGSYTIWWSVFDLFHTVQNSQEPGTAPTWTRQDATNAALRIRVNGEVVGEVSEPPIAAHPRNESIYVLRAETADRGLAGVTGYQVQYRQHGASDWSNTLTTAPTAIPRIRINVDRTKELVRIGGLTNGTTYDVRMRTVDNSDFGEWCMTTATPFLATFRFVSSDVTVVEGDIAEIEFQLNVPEGIPDANVETLVINQDVTAQNSDPIRELRGDYVGAVGHGFPNSQPLSVFQEFLLDPQAHPVTLPIVVNLDNFVEEDETFTGTWIMSGFDAAGWQPEYEGADTFTVTIKDATIPVNLARSNYVVAEGETLSLHTVAPRSLQHFDYQVTATVSDVSATRGADYSGPASYTVRTAKTEVSSTPITIAITDDGVSEHPETLTIALSAPAVLSSGLDYGVGIGSTSLATVTILDNYVWSSTLTPTALSGGGLGCEPGAQTVCDSSRLTDTSFTTAGGTDYTVTVLKDAANGELSFSTNTAMNDELRALSLYVDGQEFPLSSATVSRRSAVWTGADLSWASGTTVSLVLGQSTTPAVSLSARPNPVLEGQQVTIEAKLSDLAGQDVMIPLLFRWGREFRNGQVTDYGNLDQGDLRINGTSSVTEDGNGNRYTLWTLPGFVKINSGAHQRSYGLQRMKTNFDADTRDETFTVMLDADSPSWPAEVVEVGSPASVRVTVRDAHRFDEAPGPPRNVLAAPRNEGLYLSWDPPATGGSASSYDVHYTSRSRLQVGDQAWPVGDPSQGWAVVSPSGTQTITGLTNDTLYRVRVRSVNRSGSSSWAFGVGMPRGRDYDPHSDPTRATLGSIVVYYDGNPPVDEFRQWQPARPAHFGYRVRLPEEFSTIDPDDGSVRFTETTRAKVEVHVGNAGSTLRVGKVTYADTNQSDAQATPPVVCTHRPAVLMSGTPAHWRCVALAAVAVGEHSHVIELNAHSPNTHVEIEVTDGEVVRTWLLNIDPPARTYSLSPTARVVEGQEARLTLSLGKPAPTGGLEFAVSAGYGTARAGDLGQVASPVTVPEGSASLEIAVPTVDDDQYEGDESFTVTVAPTGSGWAVEPEGTDTSTVTIEDNDAAPEGPEPRAVQFVPGDGTLTVSWTVAPREGVEDGEIRHALRWSQTTGADHYWANPRDPNSVGPSDGITMAGGVTSYVITGLENGVATRVDLRSYIGSNHSEGSPKSSRWVTEEGEHTTPRGEPQQSPADRTYSVTAAARATEGGNASLTVTLSQAAPEGGVEFSVTAGYSGDSTAMADDVGSITSPVTVAQGNTTLAITIPTAADAVDEDDETFAVTVAARAAGWEKARDGRDTATVTIEDDDTAGVTVNAASPLAVAEDGSATYTVVLDSQPLFDVTVSASSTDDGAATVFPASHTFTPTTWNTPLTFTVNGVADDDPNDESVAVSHGVTSDDGRYAAVLLSTVAISVSDTTADAPQGDQSPR